MSSNEWNTVTLGEVANVQTGPFGSQLHQEDYVSVGTPIITVEHLGENHLIHDDLPRVTDADKQRLSKYTLKEGDIVFSRVGSVDRRALVKKEEEGWLFSGRCLRVRPTSNKLNSTFLSYYFGLDSFKKYIRAIAVGSTMPSLNTTILSEIEIPFPPLSTQRRIADILSALDEKIELNRQTNATLEAIAQSIFREWFVEFNVPDPNEIDPKGLLGNQASSQAMESGTTERPQAGQTFRVSDMVESELGLIPKGWKVLPLDEIADFLNGLALQKFPAENEKGYLPVIKIRELKNGISNSSDKASRNIPSKYIINDGDLIFSWSGTLEVKFWVGGEGALNQHLFKVTSKEYPLWFCYFWILEHLANFRGIAEDKTTTMGHIQRHHLSEALCSVPDNLTELDEVMTPLVDKIINFEQQSATLASLRDALLPKLMSGEIEV
jgi:type I restriction enzyme S subunit